MHLPEGEGDEGDVPIGAVEKPFDHVVVQVAGEGTAIVPGDGEAQGHVGCNPTGLLEIPLVHGSFQNLRMTRPRTNPIAAPPITSLAW